MLKFFKSKSKVTVKVTNSKFMVPLERSCHKDDTCQMSAPMRKPPLWHFDYSDVNGLQSYDVAEKSLRHLADRAQVLACWLIDVTYVWRRSWWVRHTRSLWKGDGGSRSPGRHDIMCINVINIISNVSKFWDESTSGTHIGLYCFPCQISIPQNRAPIQFHSS